MKLVHAEDERVPSTRVELAASDLPAARAHSGSDALVPDARRVTRGMRPRESLCGANAGFWPPAVVSADVGRPHAGRPAG
jgi:hypothetical protein